MKTQRQIKMKLNEYKKMDWTKFSSDIQEEARGYVLALEWVLR